MKFFRSDECLWCFDRFCMRPLLEPWWFMSLFWHGPVAQDKEEEEQCRRMHALFEQYHLDGQFRWLVAQRSPVRNGELYRYIAGEPLVPMVPFLQCLVVSELHECAPQTLPKAALLQCLSPKLHATLRPY
jgi:hypothetical protein